MRPAGLPRRRSRSWSEDTWCRSQARLRRISSGRTSAICSASIAASGSASPMLPARATSRGRTEPPPSTPTGILASRTTPAELSTTPSCSDPTASGTISSTPVRAMRIWPSSSFPAPHPIRARPTSTMTVSSIRPTSRFCSTPGLARMAISTATASPTRLISR